MEEKLKQQDEAEPSKIKYFLTYALFYALGLVTVVPQNFFTTANDYWMYKFRNLSSNEDYNTLNKTAMQADFTSNYNIVSSVGYVIFIILTAKFLRSKVTIFYRAISSLTIAIALFIVTCILVGADTDSWQNGYLTTTLVIGFFLTGMCGVFMVTLYESAVKFPHSFLPAIFSGQAICGILTALVQIFALGVGGGPEATGAIYFVLGTVFVVGSFAAFLVSWYRNDYFKSNVLRKHEAKKKLAFNKKTMLSALRKSKYFMISMVIILVSTIMVHPGVTSLVVSVDKGSGDPWNDSFFVPVVSFLFFNLFDYIGRESAMYVKKPTKELVVLALAFLRIPFVALIIFCNAQPRENTEVIFDDDSAYIIFLIVFAFSNGYLLNMCMIRIPTITDDNERPFAMICVLLLMVLSIAISSATSTAIVNSL